VRVPIAFEFECTDVAKVVTVPETREAPLADTTETGRRCLRADKIVPVSIAGLLSSDATVWVGPPFDANLLGSKTGFTLKRKFPLSRGASPLPHRA
jgi:hypothetical protein